MKNNTLKLLTSSILETLEDRRMMSASPVPAVLKSGVLNVTAPQSTAARVTVDLASGNSVITVDVEGERADFPVGTVHQLDITAGSGSDYIYINPAIDIPSAIHAGDGNDSIRGGGGHNIIIAGNGNDLINAEGTNNLIQAGSGDDTLMGHNDNNTITAGNGNDFIISRGRYDKLTAGNGNDTFEAGDGHSTITAGSGHDVMTGGLGNTYLYTKSTSGSGGKSSGTTTGGTTGTSGNSGTSGTGGTSGTSGNSGTSGGKTNTGTSGTTTGGTTTGGTTGTSGTNSGTSGSNSGTSGTTTGTSGTTTPVKTSSGTKPSAVLNVMSGPRVTGLVVNVDGLTSSVGAGTCITSMYSWNFGDANSDFNLITGFSAAHVYDKPGDYTITLTVTNDAGLVSTATQKVSIAASGRQQIYVDSVNGSDANNGSVNAPFQSLQAAFAQVGNNTEVLLKAGDTFYTNAGLSVNSTNVLIGRYGSGANPVIMRTLGNGLPTINAGSKTNGLTIQDITINSPYGVAANASAPKIGLGGIYLAGQNITIRDCTFLNVDDAINENGNPTGVLVQSNSAPLTTGVRGYFVWGQGQQDTILGNYAANSAREHIVRCVGVSEVNAQANNFTNLSRQSVDQYDTSKGCIEIHRGEYDWIVGNTIADGDIRVGPLGLWGEAATSNTSYCVIEDNQLTDTMIFVQSGTHHAMIDNNVITNTGGQAIVISGVDSQGRTSQDITIVNNTGVDSGAQGNFLELSGYANGIVMDNNVWVAPNIKIGDYTAAPIRVNAGVMNSFTQITGNIWPSPVTLGTYAAGGINFIGSSPLGNGYVTASQWNAQSEVGTDVFDTVTLNSSYQISYESLIAGAAIRIAA